MQGNYLSCSHIKYIINKPQKIILLILNKYHVHLSNVTDYT